MSISTRLSWNVLHVFGSVAALLCVSCLPAIGQQSTPATYAMDPQSDTGVNSYGSYDGAHDNVSVQSGAMNVCIPLVSLPGAGHHDLNIPLCYNSQLEEFVDREGSVAIQYPFPWVWGSSTPAVGPGWIMTGRSVFNSPPPYVGPAVLWKRDGSMVNEEIGNTSPATGPDMGNAGVYFWQPNTSSGTAWDRNGTSTTTSFPSNAETDRRGTTIQFGPSLVTDTLGRKVTVSASNAAGSAPAALSFSYPDSAGTSRTVSVQFTSQTYSCAYASPTTP